MSNPPLQFYFDTHMPKAAAVQLRLRGVHVVRCEEVGLAAADDTEHLEYATAHELTLVSHDLDFQNLHAQWLYAGQRHWGIVLFDHRFQGDVGKIVRDLAEWHGLIAAGAGDVLADVVNQLIEIKR